MPKILRGLNVMLINADLWGVGEDNQSWIGPSFIWILKATLMAMWSELEGKKLKDGEEFRNFI